MIAAAELTVASQMFRCNNGYITRSIAGLSPEEWNSRPNESSNSMLWIVGHCVWARTMTLKALGVPWAGVEANPWLALFKRGSSREEIAQYPSHEVIVGAWHDVDAALTAALEGASEATLAASAGEKSPSFDGTIGGLINFLAHHEAYHAGQAAYLRRLLGHDGVAG
jgi:uncharacterized damage-inducible protein DinB